MNDQKHLQRKQGWLCGCKFKGNHKGLHPRTSLRTDTCSERFKHTSAHTISSPNVTTSLSCSIDPSEGDPFEFQSGWMRQFFGCHTAAVLACPNSKHTIISLLTTADGHKVLESPSKTSSDYKQNALALCVCACHAALLAFGLKYVSLLQGINSA